MNSLFSPGFSNWQGIVSILYIITALFVSLMIIFEKRSPVKTLSWVIVILLVPFVGLITYILFGQNYRKSKIFSRKGISDLKSLQSFAAAQISSLPTRLESEIESIRDKQHLMRLMLNNNRAFLTEFNSVELLINGEKAFPSMLKAIRAAGKFIHMQFYRFEADTLGMSFFNVLIDKARSGVEVRIIVDDVGSWSLENNFLKKLKSAGVEIYQFMPVRFPNLTSKINYRNHRKVVVVDGVIGFVGGMNIANKYLVGVRSLGQWRDTHLLIRGEAVATLNSVFLTDWAFVCGKILTSNQVYLTHERIKEKCWIQMASSGPDSDWSNILQVYISAIATARQSIYISTPYFSPDETIMNAMCTASLSGVDVRIIIPEQADSVIANWNSRSYVTEMLEAGIKVYLYFAGFNHSKYMVVDNVFSSVGSPNVDIRSFDLNFEVTALIYDTNFAGKLTTMFMDDLSGCIEVKLTQWLARRRSEKFKESLARIFGPLY